MLRKKTKLLDYQVKDVRYLIEHPRSANFNDCGLGKTLEELVVIANTWKTTDNRIVIFCPKSCIVSWMDEIKKHTTLIMSGDVVVVTGTRWQKDQLLCSGGRIFITNYETALTNFERLALMKFDHVILDESTRVKNPQTVTAKAITALTDEASIVRIMSGLPMPQSATEIFSQFRIMDKGKTFGKSYNYFRTQWFKRIGKWPVIKWKLKKEVKNEFYNIVHSGCIRRTRNSVLSLPSVNSIRRVTDWQNKATRGNYTRLENSVLSSMSLSIDSDRKISNLQNKLTKITKLSQFTSGFIYDDDGIPDFLEENPKLTELSHILYDYNVFNHKMVIVGVFRPELAMVFALCKKRGLNPVLIHGGTSTDDRVERLDSFKNDPSCRVLVANQKTISYGLNLQFCSIIVFYNVMFSVEMYKQLCDRVRRVGQKHNCLLIHILVNDTFDFIRYNIVVNNLNIAEELMNIIERRQSNEK